MEECQPDPHVPLHPYPPPPHPYPTRCHSAVIKATVVPGTILSSAELGVILQINASVITNVTVGPASASTSTSFQVTPTRHNSSPTDADIVGRLLTGTANRVTGAFVTRLPGACSSPPSPYHTHQHTLLSVTMGMLAIQPALAHSCVEQCCRRNDSVSEPVGLGAVVLWFPCFTSCPLLSLPPLTVAVCLASLSHCGAACGNGRCEIGEACGNYSCNQGAQCRADCPIDIQRCPAVDSQVLLCGGLGAQCSQHALPPPLATYIEASFKAPRIPNCSLPHTAHTAHTAHTPHVTSTI
jgi:hypothetical protein